MREKGSEEVGGRGMPMRAKFLFWPCASIAPSLGSRVERGYEKSTIENRQKGNRVTELAEITNE